MGSTSFNCTSLLLTARWVLEDRLITAVPAAAAHALHGYTHAVLLPYCLCLQKERWDGAWVGEQAAQQVFKADVVHNVMEVRRVCCCLDLYNQQQPRSIRQAEAWHCGLHLLLGQRSTQPTCHGPTTCACARSCRSACSSCQQVPHQSCLTLTASVATSTRSCDKHWQQQQGAARRYR